MYKVMNGRTKSHECGICKMSLEMCLSTYTEHFRQHEKRNDRIECGTKLKCGFCVSEFPSTDKLIQHLIAFHQAPESRPSIRSSNQAFLEKSNNKISLLMDQDKKVEASIQNAKERIVENLNGVIEDFSSNPYISPHLLDEISKSLLGSISTTIQVMGNVMKESSLKDYSNKISAFHDEIILSFSDSLSDNGNGNCDIDVKEDFSSEFSPASVLIPSTSNGSTSNFDPIPVFNLLLNNSGGSRNSIVFDASINVKDTLKKLANDLMNECQEFYDINKLDEAVLYCGIDTYSQFNTPIGRAILYVLFNDSSPEFSKELITIAWKEAYAILRGILKIVKPSLDYRPKDLDPLVTQFLQFIDKEGANNEIVQAETKKILHQWIRTTRHRNKDSDANINATTKPLSSAKRKRRRVATDETIEGFAIQAQANITDLPKLEGIFRKSAPMRLDWIENAFGIDINAVLETFPAIKMFPKQLIDIDYEELCIIKKWDCISIADEMQRIFPALKYLLQNYNVTTIPESANQNDAFAMVFFSLPNLFHHFLNNSKKIPKHFYYEAASQDFLTGVNRIISEKQIQHNFIGKIETPDDAQIIFAYINGHILRIEGSLIEALEFYYRIHYVFRIDRPASIFFLTSWLDLLCKKKVETNCGPQRFMREIERLCKQFEQFPESRNSVY